MTWWMRCHIPHVVIIVANGRGGKNRRGSRGNEREGKGVDDDPDDDGDMVTSMSSMTLLLPRMGEVGVMDEVAG